MTIMEKYFQDELKMEKEKLQADVQNKRNEIIRELIESEDIYIANLKTLIMVLFNFSTINSQISQLLHILLALSRRFQFRNTRGPSNH